MILVSDMVGSKISELIIYDHDYVVDPLDKIRQMPYYMLCQSEIEACVECTMACAKKFHKKFDDLLDEEIEKNFYNGDMKLKEKLNSDPSVKSEIEGIRGHIFIMIIAEAFKKYPLLEKHLSVNLNE